MRLLHLSSEHPPQSIFGLGRYVCDLSRELVRQGHSVHVLTNSIGGTDQDIIYYGVSLHRVDFPPPPQPPGNSAPALAFNLHLQQRAHSLGRDQLGNPEVVISHDWLTAVAGHRIAKRLKIPHVWTVHDTILGKMNCLLTEPDHVLTAALERWACDVADIVIVNSLAIQSEVINSYQCSGTKTRVLYCGVDPERFTSTQDPARLAAFRSVLADPEELLITYAGRWDPEKGIDTLINAFSIVRQSGVPARLALAGKGILEDTIKEHIRSLGLQDAVSMVGYLGDEALKGFYRVSDLHICPSHYEPFGLVAVEAMAAGAALISSNTGGLAEIITSNDVGRLVPCRQVEPLAQAICDLYANEHERKQLGLLGAEHVRRHFAWNIIAPQAVAVYQEAISLCMRTDDAMTCPI